MLHDDYPTLELDLFVGTSQSEQDSTDRSDIIQTRNKQVRRPH